MTNATETTGGPETGPSHADAPPALDGTAPVTTRPYHPDRLSRSATLLGILLAAAGSFVVTLAAWWALKQTSLPAFGTSMVTRALASAVIIAVILVVAVLMWLWVRDEHRGNPRWNGGSALPVTRPRWRVWLTYAATYLSPAAIVIAVLAIPLSSARLYLDGISVDQGFRTQYMTRAADGILISDMNYIDMPAHYPVGWFWIGGRFANLLGLPGWEAFQPWAIVSLAVTASILVPVWQRITGSLPTAVGVALVTVCVVMVMSAEEPYAAIVAMGIPAMAAISPRILRGDLFALAGGVIFLGVSATLYTLFTAVIALSVVAVCAVMTSAMRRTWRPIIWLVVLGASSMLIALISWGPYLFARAAGAEQSGDTALHYLPLEGTQFPVPIFASSVIGLLCLVGVVYLVLNIRIAEARSLAVALGVFYAWIGMSMAVTLIGTTLLGFRLDTLIVATLATAGVLGIADARLVGLYSLYPDRITRRTARNTSMVLIVLVAFGGLSYAQNIPQMNSHAIDLAYTDTDGYGERADRYPAGSARYYAEIDSHLRDLGFEPSETVVLTDEQNFMSYHPYRGFQAFTSHYANPLGEFAKRNEQIETWAVDSWTFLQNPADFVASLDGSRWTPPEVFIFRGDMEDAPAGWKYDLSEDIYPNNPNVRFRGIYFNPEVFLGDGAPWSAAQIGPFVVVTRDE
ncbi:galactan 5-O-arabinofuranosyltransferase [Corynebacterium pacaense]|uniref:galactan 5-O-arabinofuranosyltransferase n=1 Tax=Corynebacterium pacaense TaxID=1816684 RepID=UPI0009BB7393|nr:galactan 5-O-arabinofuranosyltransferase [Corynebacterium pacaense]